MFAWTVWGLTVWEVLTGDAWASQRLHRDLDCLELWCGVGAVWRATMGSGLRSRGCDKARSMADDILTQGGFIRALQFTLQLAEAGLVWLAPCVCLVEQPEPDQHPTAQGHLGQFAMPVSGAREQHG